MKITNKQKLEIEEIKDNWIKYNFEDYFKTIKGEYSLFKDLDFKTFSKRLKEELDNKDNDTKTPTLLSDDYFYSENFNNTLENFKEGIKEEFNSELINFDTDNLYNTASEFYYDDDYYKETLSTIFNYDITKEIKNSYSSYFVTIHSININDDIDIKDYEDFEEFKNDFENVLYQVDKNELIKMYIYDFHYEVFNWFCDTKKIDDLNTKTIKEIEELIKIEIPLRLKNKKKALRDNQKVTTILKEEYAKNIELKENEKRNIENKIKALKGYLKK